MGIETGRNGGGHVAAQEQQGGTGSCRHSSGRQVQGGAACRGRGQVGAGAGGQSPAAWGQEADLRSTGRMQGVAARREQRQRPGGEKGGGQGRRRLQMQKKRAAGDRGAGVFI